MSINVHCQKEREEKRKKKVYLPIELRGEIKYRQALT